MEIRGNIFIGFYLSLGDLVCAHRALSKFAHGNNEFQIYIGVGKSAESAKDIFLWPANIAFISFVLPRVGTIGPSFEFVKEFYSRKYVRVINSPHAPLRRMSWKIPLFMKLAALIGYADSIEGPSHDPFSFLYKRTWPVSREIPLTIRDEVFFDLIGLSDKNRTQQNLEQPSTPIFNVSMPERNAIGIHVGASVSIKRWPAEHVVRLCWLLRARFPNLEIDLFGLESELSEIVLQKLPIHTNIAIGSFSESVARVTSLRAIVTMDSGFMHVASAARMRQVAIFGPSSVKPHLPLNPRAIAVDRQVLSCQPCDLLKCRFAKNYCMHLVTPEQVLEGLVYVLSLP